MTLDLIPPERGLSVILLQLFTDSVEPSIGVAEIPPKKLWNTNGIATVSLAVKKISEAPSDWAEISLSSTPIRMEYTLLRYFHSDELTTNLE